MREEYARHNSSLRGQVLFSRASLGKQVAQNRFHQWAIEVEQRIDAIRKTQRGEGIDLDREQAAALAGQWYLWFVAKYEKENVDPEAYEQALWDVIDDMLAFAPEEVREQPLRDMRWARDPDVRQGVRAVVADRGHTALFLASRGLALTNKAHALFLDRVLDNYLPALLRLEHRARGDYSPDELPKSFPPFTLQASRSDTGLSPQELFEAWVEARKPAHSTIESWRTVFKALSEHFPGRTASSITADEARNGLTRW